MLLVFTFILLAPLNYDILFLIIKSLFTKDYCFIFNVFIIIWGNSSLMSFPLPLSSRLYSFTGIVSLDINFLSVFSLTRFSHPPFLPSSFPLQYISTFPSPPPSHFLPSIIPCIRKSEHCFMCPCHCPAGNASMYHNSFHIFVPGKILLLFVFIFLYDFVENM